MVKGYADTTVADIVAARRRRQKSRSTDIHRQAACFWKPSSSSRRTSLTCACLLLRRGELAATRLECAPNAPEPDRVEPRHRSPAPGRVLCRQAPRPSAARRKITRRSRLPRKATATVRKRASSRTCPRRPSRARRFEIIQRQVEDGQHCRNPAPSAAAHLHRDSTVRGPDEANAWSRR